MCHLDFMTTCTIYRVHRNTITTLVRCRLKFLISEAFQQQKGSFLVFVLQVINFLSRIMVLFLRLGAWSVFLHQPPLTINADYSGVGNCRRSFSNTVPKVVLGIGSLCRVEGFSPCGPPYFLQDLLAQRRNSFLGSPSFAKYLCCS